MVFIPSDAMLLIWQCACFGIIRINHGINTIVGSALEQRGVPHPDALGILAVVDAFGARKERRCDKPTVEGGAQRGRCVHRGRYEGGRWRSRYRRHCTKRAAVRQGPGVLRQGAPTRAPAWPWVRVLPDKFARESARHGREVTVGIWFFYHGNLVFLPWLPQWSPLVTCRYREGKDVPTQEQEERKDIPNHTPSIQYLFMHKGKTAVVRASSISLVLIPHCVGFNTMHKGKTAVVRASSTSLVLISYCLGFNTIVSLFVGCCVFTDEHKDQGQGRSGSACPHQIYLVRDIRPAVRHVRAPADPCRPRLRHRTSPATQLPCCRAADAP